MLLNQLRQLMEYSTSSNTRKAAKQWLRLLASDENLRARLLQHIQRTVDFLQRKDDSDWRSHAQSLLNSVNVGTLVVDAGGQPLVINQRAQEILDRKDGLLLQNGRLAANSSTGTMELRQAIVTATQWRSAETSASTTVLALKRHSAQRALIASVRPVPKNSTDNDFPISAYLVVCDPETPRPVQPDGLRSLFGLTPTEARLAAELANGASLEHAAERLGITVGTARVHLKHIFSKTETNRQSELIHFLLNSGIGIFHSMAGLGWEFSATWCRATELNLTCGWT
jgi:DNA-binding HTH domain-containing proteins